MEEKNIVEVTRDEDIEVLDEPAEDEELSFGKIGYVTGGVLLAGAVYGIAKGVIWVKEKIKERRVKKTENDPMVSEPTADADKK